MNEHFSQLLQLFTDDFIERSVNDNILYLVLEAFDLYRATRCKSSSLSDMANLVRYFLGLCPGCRSDVKARRRVFRDNIRSIAAMSDDAVNSYMTWQLLSQCADAVEQQDDGIESIDSLFRRTGRMSSFAIEMKIQRVNSKAV
ncbi:hypothetical protein D3C73_1102310 [compost metagenome]